MVRRVSIRRILRHDGPAKLFVAFGIFALFLAVDGLMRAASYLPHFHDRSGRIIGEQETIGVSAICGIIALILFLMLSLKISRIRTVISKGIHARAEVYSIEHFKAARFRLRFIDDRKGQTAEIAVFLTKDVRAIEVGDIVDVAINPNNSNQVLIVCLYTVPAKSTEQLT